MNVKAPTRMKRFFVAPALAAGLLLAAATPAARAAPAAELLMFESPACAYCRQWHEEVGVIYAKTPEGRAAPLRRIDIHDPAPEVRAMAREIVYTPTFVLRVEGAEVGRIPGYPGEDFFWPMLGNLLDEAGLETDRPQDENRNGEKRP
jgi:hypothetical protein